MNKIAIAKKIVTTIVSIGSAQIAHRIIANNVHATTKTERITVAAGSLALGGAIGELAADYTDRQIDEIVATWQKITNRKNA